MGGGVWLARRTHTRRSCHCPLSLRRPEAWGWQGARGTNVGTNRAPLRPPLTRQARWATLPKAASGEGLVSRPAEGLRDGAGDLFGKQALCPHGQDKVPGMGYGSSRTVSEEGPRRRPARLNFGLPALGPPAHLVPPHSYAQILHFFHRESWPLPGRTAPS